MQGLLLIRVSKSRETLLQILKRWQHILKIFWNSPLITKRGENKVCVFLFHCIDRMQKDNLVLNKSCKICVCFIAILKQIDAPGQVTLYALLRVTFFYHKFNIIHIQTSLYHIFNKIRLFLQTTKKQLSCKMFLKIIRLYLTRSRGIKTKD